MKKEILSYGDSNTWGYKPGTGGRHESEDRWVQVAEAHLGKEYNLSAEGHRQLGLAVARWIKAELC